MPIYSSPQYDDARKWIRKAREKEMEWDSIKYAGKGNEEGLADFIDRKADEDWWEITVQEWLNLVDYECKQEELMKSAEEYHGQAMLYDDNSDNDVFVPTDKHSSWILYKERLRKLGFDEVAVHNIENSSIKILKRLSNDTTSLRPIKGMVVGNVQSGKTANMAALMAMAADWDWNMFIILSGTIENLRKQTQSRLFGDLYNNRGNRKWVMLEHLAKNMPEGQRLQDLDLGENARERFFTVCLKIPSRLRNLIQWLQSDKNKQKQLKIILIDDEADQASINTADIHSDERKAVNDLICSLVNCKNYQGKNIEEKYKAMNYIGYTATPYANVLNDSREESLYPRSFISTLAVSKEYFGPQQIFGVDGGDYDGLDIIRTIDDKELECIRELHNEDDDNLPETLKDAICWFLCGVSTMRGRGYTKPVSMLVHTSQKTPHHASVAKAIREFFDNTSADRIVDRCKKVWDRETKRFSIEKFADQYPDYARLDEIEDYPQFNEIEDEIRLMLKTGMSNIPLDEEGDFQYHRGIHLCIDNCKSNKLEDGMYVRLAYPKKDHHLDFASAFIVVGGQTLSRGLTIEGLLSTYFLRSVGQADTLMQMGRWFGYRRHYELLTRMWLTQKAVEQFKFLSVMDENFRSEIHRMDVFGERPEIYGPKIQNTYAMNFLRITAQNRMQSAQMVDMDFSGSYSQTYLFDDNAKVLEDNLDIVTTFVNSLGNPEKRKPVNEKHVGKNLVWRNVDFEMICDLLRKYKFQNRLSVFNDISSFIEWLVDNDKTKWNVIVSNHDNGEGGIWELEHCKVKKAVRSKKANYDYKDVINIGSLRAPDDIIADVDLDGQSDELHEKVASYTIADAKIIRSMAGLDDVQQLIIYCIDKDSVPKASSLKSGSRLPLEAPVDIVGLCVNVPGARDGKGFATHLQIKLENSVLNNEIDLEGIDED